MNGHVNRLLLLFLCALLVTACIQPYQQPAIPIQSISPLSEHEITSVIPSGTKIIAKFGTSVDVCNLVAVTVKGVYYTDCTGSALKLGFTKEFNKDYFMYVIGTYKPFEVTIDSSLIQFYGEGERLPSSGELYMIGDWVNLELSKAVSGRIGANWPLIFAWYRTDKAAGRKDSLSLIIPGRAVTDSYDLQTRSWGHWKSRTLSAAELDQLYQWRAEVGICCSDEFTQTPGITIQLGMSGSAKRAVSLAQQLALSHWAEALFEKNVK